MAFGFKVKNLKFSREYSAEELVEQLKKTTFDAGEPSVVKHGFNIMVTFPPIDRQNQVWLMNMNMKANQPSAKWSLQLSHEIAGDFGNMAANAVLDHLTDGISGLGSVFGKKAKKGEAQVEEIAAKITALNL